MCAGISNTESVGHFRATVNAGGVLTDLTHLRQCSKLNDA